MGRLAISSGLFLFEGIGPGQLTGGVGPWPKAPIMPPFSLPGREILPGWEKE